MVELFFRKNWRSWIDELKFGKRKYNRRRILEGQWVFWSAGPETKKIFLIQAFITSRGFRNLICAPKFLTKQFEIMKDYTTDNYCDILWISDILALEKNDKKEFTATFRKNNFAKTVTVSNVILFGTIVEVKQTGTKGFLYQVDDGTGVIGCKHNEENFEDFICMIENEQCELVNQTLLVKQGLEQSMVADTSTDDSIFNDKSMQNIDIEVKKRNQLMAMQSLWESIYSSFSCLTDRYNIGDVVNIEGKLYNYYNTNQVYVNSIRKMSLAEEIVKMRIKLENGYDPLPTVKTQNYDKRNINVPEQRFEIPEKEKEEVVPPHLDSTITFDTLNE